MPEARARRLRLERVVAVLAVLGLAVAWVVGERLAISESEPALIRAFPGARAIEPIGAETYQLREAAADAIAVEGDGDLEVLPELVPAGEPQGYIAVATADGYGGPLKVAVGVDRRGLVRGVVVVEHRETPSFFDRVLRSGMIDAVVGQPAADLVAARIDALSGASRTAGAVAAATSEACRRVAGDELGLVVPEPEPPRMELGFPELVLGLLLVLGLVGRRCRTPVKRVLRWISLVTGLVVLGFWLDLPLSLTFVNRLLLGFWPQWHDHVYWYLLTGSILVIVLTEARNPYCDWFCPFGAAQECLGAIGGARARPPAEAYELLRWLQRLLAWLALVLGLTMRNPGLAGYEIFGAVFDLAGSSILLALAAIMLIMSLFVRRPWCRLLCPVRPVIELLQLMRAWAKQMLGMVR